MSLDITCVFYVSVLLATASFSSICAPVLFLTVDLIKLGVADIPHEFSHIHGDLEPELMCEL